MRKLPAKPAVEPLVAFARGDGQGLDAAHPGTTARATKTPTAIAASDRNTEAPT